MRSLRVLAGCLIAAMSVGCETSEAPVEEEVPVEEGVIIQEEVEAQEEEPEENLANVDEWRFGIEPHEEGFLVTLHDGDSQLLSRAAYEEGGTRAFPVVGEHFATDFCGKNVVAAQLKTPFGTGVSSGTFYHYILVDRSEAEVVSVLLGSESTDRDGSEINNDWEELESALRAGVEEGAEECEKGSGGFWID